MKERIWTRLFLLTLVPLLLEPLRAAQNETQDGKADQLQPTPKEAGAGGPGFGFALGSGMFGQGPSRRTFVEKRTASVAASILKARRGHWMGARSNG